MPHPTFAHPRVRMPSLRLFPSLVLLVFLTGTLSACADIPKDPQERAQFEATDDPLEPMNRTIFDVNDFLDRLMFKPLAGLYRATIPPWVRDRVAGILSNMREPVIFANNLLQGEWSRAGITAERFAMNTTIGVAGMWDVAGMWEGAYQQVGDFGQTLYSWGISSGPYLVLPLFGPSNFRDAIGLGVDSLTTPWQYLADMGGNGTYWRFQYVYFASDGIVKREQNIEALDALRSGSLDFYAQMRSVSRQYRDKQLGIKPPAAEIPNFDEY